MTGVDIRVQRLFRRGSLLLAALDHGQYVGVPEGLDDIVGLTQKLAGAPFDGFIVNAGIVPALPAFPADKSLVLRITHAGTAISGTSRTNSYYLGPEDALRLGADAVISMVILGHEGDPEALHELTKAVADYHRYGIPVIAEILPASAELFSSPKTIADLCRIGAELGADVIKTAYTPDFRSVVAGCPAPVIIAGGSKNADFIASLREAMREGARGLALGRNLYQRDEPASFIREVAAAMGRAEQP